MSGLLGTIDPIAFSLGPVEVAWYGVIIAVGILVALFLASREAERLGLDDELVTDIALWVVPLGFIGARLYYVLFELDYYLQNPGQIIAIWNGGLAIYGGIIGGVLAIIWFSNRKNLPVWLIFDIAAPSVMIAQAIGRWGNFVNQEAHGGEVSREFLENLQLPEFIINQMNIDGTYYHPTFLYESVWNVIGFVIVLYLRRKPNLFKRGEVALFYIAWYAFGRFFIEGMRTDSLYIGDTSIRVSQLLSFLLFFGAIGVGIYRRRNTFPELPYYNEGIEPELRFQEKKQEYEKKNK
jgi:phosphatidylglycerol:prolipoprotein diacylglycerol transferase